MNSLATSFGFRVRTNLNLFLLDSFSSRAIFQDIVLLVEEFAVAQRDLPRALVAQVPDLDSGQLVQPLYGS